MKINSKTKVIKNIFFTIFLSLFINSKKAKSNSLRNLDFNSEVERICKKGSNNLNEYYKNGNMTNIDIDQDEIIEKEKTKIYADALVNILGKEENEEENLKKYLKHLSTPFFFLTLGFLILPFWIILWVFHCNNCYILNFYLKDKCKRPFYYITIIIYGSITIICIYGLTQSNSLFVNLAETECSLLKFLNEVLDGETKKNLPRWGGIIGINETFLKLNSEINNFNENLLNGLNNSQNNVDLKRKLFENKIINFGEYIQNNHLDNNNQLLITKEFGDKNKKKLTLTHDWIYEYTETGNKLNNFRYDIFNNSKNINFRKNIFSNSITDGTNEINEIKNSFNNMVEKIANGIIDYSDYIDKYGKLFFKIVFSLLLVFNILLGAFFSIKIYFGFGDNITKFKTTLLKTIFHILWNILTLLTCGTLLLGSIFTFVGYIGKDLIYVFKYIVSDENLNKSEPILVSGAEKYLKICVNGDGNITSELGLNLEIVDIINHLRIISANFSPFKSEIQNLTENMPIYSEYKNKFDNITNYKEDFQIIMDKNEILDFSEAVILANDKISSEKIKFLTILSLCNWCREPSYFCVKDSIKGNYTSTESVLINMNSIINLILLAKNGNETVDSIWKILSILKSDYYNYLKSEYDSLDLYNNTIYELISLFNKYVGNKEEAFKIINCKFIGKNLRILLKYLNKSVGKKFTNIGIILNITGFAMIIAISFTIFLNIIFTVKQKKKKFRSNIVKDKIKNVEYPYYKTNDFHIIYTDINTQHILDTDY